MTTQRQSPVAKFTGFPAAGIAYGLVVALALGFGCGLVHAPFLAVVVLGLIVAGGSLWAERDALTLGPNGQRRTNIRLQLAAAYVFMAIVAIGLVSLGYFLRTAMRH
ncbi:hypothetical protein [Phenylobacterium sp.]|uniref:hypothetical protein n=1 Tax=Phenylobacterium sp. TaxID=1871053 RepID=UPI002C6B2776|nr:hypothetical protein [Phenylobacterium sp.]HLZ76079.1 hypothetical protein [Phenylobacterium sp.]